MLGWASGAAAFNQTSTVTPTASSIVNAALNSVGGNSNALTQTNLSGGNQAAGYTAGGLTDLDAAVGIGAANTTGVTQVGPGAGPGNQDMGFIADALTFLSLGVNASNLNLSTLGQLSAGSAAKNQTAMVSQTGLLDIDSTANGTSLNVLTGVQAMTGAGNQNADADVTGAAIVGQAITGDAGNASGLQQAAVGAGSANQDAGNTSVAGNFVTTLQNVITQNFLGITQICGSNCNQSATPTMIAIGAGLQVADTSATNTNALSQIATAGAGGAANQDLDNLSTATLATLAAQGVATGNAVNVIQVSGGTAASNQNAPVVTVALGTAGQLIVGDATNLNVIGQTATGMAANQGLDNASAATGLLAGTQAATTTNAVGVTQVGGLSGQNNQTAPVTALATNDATQAIVGAMGNLNAINQVAGADNSNQALDNTAAAVGIALGGQVSDSSNAIGVTQVNGSGQGNQSAPVVAVSDTDASQLVGVAAGNQNVLNQLSAGAGSSNQDLTNASVALGTALADQDAGSANNIGVFQFSAGGQASQFAPVTAVADTDVDQTVGATAINQNGINQIGANGGPGNQAVDNTVAAVGIAGASQDADAVNNVVATQNAGVSTGAAAQALQITPTASVTGDQTVGSVALNGTTINQLDGTCCQVNQDASNDATAASLVGATQDLDATNNVNAAQNLNLNSAAGAQFAQVTPTAIVDADQDVSGLSANGNTLNQVAGGSNQGNQDMDNDSDAATLVGATQDASATNTVNLNQSGIAQNGAIAQAGNVAPTAITTADQDVAGVSANGNNLTQVGGQAGQNNQGMTNDTSAGTAVGASQTAASDNTTNITQFCQVQNGACAQYFDVAPTAMTVADQDVTGASANDNTLTQVGGSGQDNQMAANTSDADTTVDADQDLSSGNDTNVVQVCTVIGGACAQYTGSTDTSITAGSQTVGGASANDNDIVQVAGSGQGNQDADNDTSATTDIDADQTLSSGNDTDLTQMATGATPANQAATSNNNAVTAADQTITGTSANDNGITQVGGAGMTNQDADNTSTAATDIDATQNLDTQNDSNTTQVSTGAAPANQTASNNSTAVTTSSLNITGTSGNTTNIVQQ